ncbi:MAG: GNAT family N-acetyltransferase [Anaerovoracaceae bacterium]|jgi:ribosomal protein S18 acetylase RimI-like enzyme
MKINKEKDNLKDNVKIVDGAGYMPQVKELIEEYTRRLGRDLSFQDLEEELRDPAGKYTPPQGELLVALQGEDVIGMVAYHRHSSTRCEMKRLYVKPAARGLHLGETLVRAIISHAKSAGYEEMVLDTIAPLESAIHLYEKCGFTACRPYYENPMEDVLYFHRSL